MVSVPRSEGTSLRAFFAVWPDAAAAVALRALADDVANRMSGRASQPSNLHLTIAFVGEIAAGDPHAETRRRTGGDQAQSALVDRDQEGDERPEGERYDDGRAVGPRAVDGEGAAELDIH